MTFQNHILQPIILRCVFALALLPFAGDVFAQSDNHEAVAAFVETYNAQRASRDWATVEQQNVHFLVEENNLLVAFLGEGEIRIDLDRDGADPMDGMFPVTIEQATVIATNATILFIDPAGDQHFAFSLLDSPMMPELASGYFTIFQGYGIGKRAVTE